MKNTEDQASASSKKPRLAYSVDGRTVPEALIRRIETSPLATMYRYKKDGAYLDVTWQQFFERMQKLYGAFAKLGLKPGDAVAVLSQTRPEFLLIDQTNFCSGLTTVPIYYSNTVEDTGFILDNCEAKVAVAEDEPSLIKLSQAFVVSKKAIPIIALYRPTSVPEGLQVHVFEDLMQVDAPAGSEAKLKQIVSKVRPEDTATIVYTSGTTGTPKGVVLTHNNLAEELRALVREAGLTPQDTTLTFLPMAHIMARIESMVGIFSGCVLNFAESINSVSQDIGEIAPSLLVSVPRIFEKIYAKIQSEIQAAPEMRRNIFNWAVRIGKEYVLLQTEKKPIPLNLAVKYRVADKLVFSKIRAKLGGRLRLSLSGGAPLNRDLCVFFHACGICIIEAYGLTETTAAVTVNRPGDVRFGTVGRPLPHTQIRIAADGEILVKGPVVFKEYFKNPQATKEVFQDGWFATGDIGEIDDRGMLRITDRKKELLVTSAGKNIAPQKLENCLKGSRLISNAMVYGDKEKYVVALVAINEAEVGKWAKSQGITQTSCADLCVNEQVVKLIETEVKRLNEELAHYESIKKVTIVPSDFTVETGELTPSLKLKRKAIIAKYKGSIEKMYRA